MTRFRMISLPMVLTDAYQDVLWNPRENSRVLGNWNVEQYKIDSVTVATDLITIDRAHGFVADDRIFLRGDGILPAGALAYDVPYFVLAAGLTATSFKVGLLSGGAPVSITSTLLGTSFVHRCGLEINAESIKNMLVTCQFTSGVGGVNAAANFKFLDWFDGTDYVEEQTLTPGSPYVSAYDDTFQTATIATGGNISYIKPLMVDIGNERFKIQVKETVAQGVGAYGSVVFKLEGEVM